MSRFVFRAKDWTGKTVKGALDLPDKTQVIESIKSNGLVPLSVEEERSTVLKEIYRKFFSRVKSKDVTAMTRQLSTMMTAGLPLTDALSLLKNQAEGNMGLYDILDYCLNQVRGGNSLGKAMGKYESVFGEAYVASIVAGEEAGVLEDILNKLAMSMEGQEEFNGKVKGAMIYPVIVVVGMILVAFIMMIFVIPKLTSLYSDFGSKMPGPTRVLMSISDFTTKWWFLMPLVAVGGYFGMKAGNQNADFRLKKDVYKLKFPIMGDLLKKTMLANTLRTLSMLLAAGIGLVEALRIVAKVAGNELYFRSFNRIAERVQKGFSIASSFEETQVFPIIVEQMISTGEATGKLDEVLLKSSNYFATEAEQSVKVLTSAIEPVIMIVLGIGVAFLVIAVIMPIYNLTSQF